jgi:hypothetical protein
MNRKRERRYAYGDPSEGAVCDEGCFMLQCFSAPKLSLS